MKFCALTVNDEWPESIQQPRQGQMPLLRLQSQTRQSGEKLRRESRHGLWRMTRGLADAVAWGLFPKALLQNLPKPPKDPESKADRPSAKSRVNPYKT